MNRHTVTLRERITPEALGANLGKIVLVIVLGLAGIRAIAVYGDRTVTPAALPPGVAPARDATLTAIMRANIAEFSDASWYSSLHLDGGSPDVAVKDGLLIVATILAPDDIAAASQICHTVAAMTHDPNTASQLPINAVVVISGGQKVTDCRPPN
jgi:hypothetical protein